MHCFSKNQLYIPFTQEELNKHQLIILYSLKNLFGYINIEASDIERQGKKISIRTLSFLLCLPDN